MSPSLKLAFDSNDKKVDTTLFRDMIDNLLYLTIGRLNIMLSVYLCARYQVNPKEYYLLAIKRIIRYLVSTQHLDIGYPKSNTCSILGYSNVDFVESQTNRKSTIRG